MPAVGPAQDQYSFIHQVTMSKTVKKALTFPLGGVVRREEYRKQTRPYSAPWAVNVRGLATLEDRERGGSRPGLAKVSATDLGSNITAMFPVVSIDSDGNRDYDLIVIANGIFYKLSGSVASTGTSALATSGLDITVGGVTIIFPAGVTSANPIGDTNAYSATARGGKLLLADSVLREYDPQTGAVTPVVATSGTIPAAQPLICLYRDRLILGGENHIWYASRQSDITDWDFGGDPGDMGRAVAGHMAHAGLIGEKPQVMVPIEDKALIFGTKNSLWVLYGDPVSGSLERISNEIGVIAPEAWAMSPEGQVAFLSNDGVYLWTAGSKSAPVRFSEGRIPGQLRNVSSTTNTISMAYDATGRGYHLFITPTGGDGTHWWLDVENKALWPVHFQTVHQPTAVARVNDVALGEALMGCQDGYIRKFNTDSTDDDGTTLESHVLVGPVRMSSDDTRDAMVAELHGMMADISSTVTWRLVVGDSAETAADAAVAGITAVLAGNTPSDVAASGSWHSGRNAVERTRARGLWAVVWITSETQWAYEAVAIVARQFGRKRYVN